MTLVKASLLILVALAGVFGVRVAAAPAQSAGAVELFVSPGGRDSWPGTKSRPFATLAGAQRALRARTAGMSSDIVVSLRAGTYRLRRPLRLSAAAGDSGENGYRVIYQAYGYGTPARERVVISGGRRVTGWRRAENVDGAWRADVGPLETRQLFVDGRRARRTALGRGLPGKAIRVRTGYATRNTVPQSWQHAEDIELVFNGAKGGLPYSEARCSVSRIRGDSEWSLIVLDEPCFGNLKKAYEADAPGLRPVAPTDVENSLLGRRRAVLVAEGHTHGRGHARRQHAAAARRPGRILPGRRRLRRHPGHRRTAVRLRPRSAPPPPSRSGRRGRASRCSGSAGT